MNCVKYLFPIEPDQFDPPSTTPNITCGEQLSGFVNETIVEYYRFYITDTTWLPIEIYVSYWPYEYMIKKVTDDVSGTGNDYEILEFGDAPFYITEDMRDTYTNGEYLIVVQYPYGDEYFNISIDCGDPPTHDPTVDPTISPSNYPSVSPTLAPTDPPKLNRSVMVGLVFGSMGTLMFLMVSYYVYEAVQYHKNKMERKQSEAGDKSGDVASHKAIVSNSTVSAMGTSIELGATSKDAATDGGVTGVTAIAAVKVKSNEDSDGEELNGVGVEEKDEMDKEMDVLQATAEKREGRGMSINGVDVRRIDKDKGILEQMDEDEDVVQVVLAHALDCCNDGEEFDIFQVVCMFFFCV